MRTPDDVDDWNRLREELANVARTILDSPGFWVYIGVAWLSCVGLAVMHFFL